MTDETKRTIGRALSVAQAATLAGYIANPNEYAANVYTMFVVWNLVGCALLVAAMTLLAAARVALIVKAGATQEIAVDTAKLRDALRDAYWLPARALTIAQVVALGACGWWWWCAAVAATLVVSLTLRFVAER